MAVWLDFRIAWFRHFTQTAHKLMPAEPNLLNQNFVRETELVQTSHKQQSHSKQVYICTATFTHGLRGFHLEHMTSKQIISIK